MQDVPTETEAERVCRLGEAIFGRLDVSQYPVGSYVAIDVASGDFVQASNDLDLLDKAESAFKGAPYYIRKVGGPPYRTGAVRG